MRSRIALSLALVLLAAAVITATPALAGAPGQQQVANCSDSTATILLSSGEPIDFWLNSVVAEGGGIDGAAAVCSCSGTCGLFGSCACTSCSGCSTSDCQACCNQGCEENCRPE